MNVFVLNTGRCGSDAFAHACQAMTNFTSAHESRTSLVGNDRLDYPDDHVEVDNRLSWYLGRLDQKYGQRGYYVHLQRDLDKVVASYARRHGRGVMSGFEHGILIRDKRRDAPISPEELALEVCTTITANIESFLHDKPHRLTVRLENIEEDFRKFWEWIGAEGDLETALRSFSSPRNTTTQIVARHQQNQRKRLQTLPRRFLLKLLRAARGLPNYLKRI